MNYLRQSILLITLIFSTIANALPPRYVRSISDVPVIAKTVGNHSYAFEAGKYNYRFFFEYGPVEMIVHKVIGYDAKGVRIATSPPELMDLTFCNYDCSITCRWICTGDDTATSQSDIILGFAGQGSARYARTTSYIKVPEFFFGNESIEHVTLDVTILDGSLSVGPWLVMTTDWADESAINAHKEMLLW